MTASMHMAVVDTSFLSPNELARLRARLRAELANQAAQGAGHEAAVSQLTGQMDADSVLERELAEACALRAREAIEDIEHALQQIERGTYGACEACGTPIPYERLEVIPQARLCVTCSGRPAGLLR
jgi:DnaK suppressor protein